MSLTYRDDTGAYVLAAVQGSDLEALAREAGLTLSKTASRRQGQAVYFTRDPYAALPFWDHADEAARLEMALMHGEMEASWATEAGGWSPPAPDGMEFMPFQSAGVRYALQRRHACIGDEPGLGKTVQAIGIANEIDARRVLVVCPAGVRRHWEGMILAWSTLPRSTVYRIDKSRDGVSREARWIVVSYDLARSEHIHAALMSLEYDLMVLDEAHYLKSPEAQRTRALFGWWDDRDQEGLASRSARVVGLTGTPLPNRPRECYTVVRALCHDAIDWLSFDGFRHRYNPSFTWPSGHREERTGRLPELYARLRCNLMVRRLKSDVLTQLPDKTYELTYLEENGAVRRALQAERLLDVDPTDLGDVDGDTMGQISTVRREMGEAKVPLVRQHVDVLLDGGVEKLVLFAWHRSVMEELESQLARYGVARHDGGMSPGQKHKAVRKFIEDPRTRVFLGNLLSAGTGIDGLQDVASHVAFAEMSWVPGENEQCVDRLHRHGQKASVVAQFLVAPGSFDERVAATMLEKYQGINATLDRR